MVELGLHLAAACNVEDGVDTEERLALELLYLAFALHYELHGHALHAACREGGLNLAPKHGRELETHDAIEDATRLLGVDKAHVEMTRVGYCL